MYFSVTTKLFDQCVLFPQFFTRNEFVDQNHVVSFWKCCLYVPKMHTEIIWAKWNQQLQWHYKIKHLILPTGKSCKCCRVKYLSTLNAKVLQREKTI